MKLIAPWTKILIILRNPVDRAFSNWKLTYQTLGIKTRPFEKILKTEVEHLQQFGLSTAPLLGAVDDDNSSFDIPIPYGIRGDKVLEASAELAQLNLKKKDKLKCGSKFMALDWVLRL